MNMNSYRTCRICGSGNNPIVAAERPCALWYDKPWMPEDHYTLIRCRACGNLYVDSDVTEEYLMTLMSVEVPEFSEKTTYEGDAEVEATRIGELANNWELIKRVRKPHAGEKLLDYGSAWGAFGNIAQQDGVIPNGVELQPQAVRSSLKLWGEGLVHDGPLETAPFHSGEFKYISSFETLEHLFDPVKVLRKLKDFLADDGILTISVPSADYFMFKYWLYRKQPFSAWMRRHMPGNMQGGRVLIHNHINTFSVRSAALMLRKAGLRPVYVTSVGWRGGRAGRACSLVGDALWALSGHRVAFAPSIFMVADKGC